MKKTLAVLIGLASVNTYADYLFESDLRIEANSRETVSEVDIDVNYGDATFYFGKVDTSKGPLGEAAFLSKSSSVSVAKQNSTRSFESSGNKYIEKIDSANLTLVLGEIGYMELDASVSSYHDSPNLFGEPSKDKSWNGKFGAYINDSAVIGLELGRSDVTSFASLNASLEEVGVFYKHVIDLGTENWLNVEAYLGQGTANFRGWSEEKLNVASALVAWYPSANWSVGLLSEFVFHDDSDRYTETLSTEYFFNENVAINAAFGVGAISSDDSFDSDTDVINTNVGLKVRF